MKKNNKPKPTGKYTYPAQVLFKKVQIRKRGVPEPPPVVDDDHSFDLSFDLSFDS